MKKAFLVSYIATTRVVIDTGDKTISEMSVDEFVDKLHSLANPKISKDIDNYLILDNLEFKPDLEKPYGELEGEEK